MQATEVAEASTIKPTTHAQQQLGSNHRNHQSPVTFLVNLVLRKRPRDPVTRSHRSDVTNHEDSARYEASDMALLGISSTVGVPFREGSTVTRANQLRLTVGFGWTRPFWVRCCGGANSFLGAESTRAQVNETPGAKTDQTQRNPAKPGQTQPNPATPSQTQPNPAKTS